MNIDDAESLRFTTDEGEEVIIESFVMEQSAHVIMAGYDSDESEDETIARHLLKARRLWDGSPEPNLILSPLRSRHGGLPPFVITSWLRSGMDRIVVVVFVDMHPDKSIQEIFEIYFHQINFKVLAGIDQEEERKMFEWFSKA